jgi:hypothetical protein
VIFKALSLQQPKADQIHDFPLFRFATLAPMSLFSETTVSIPADLLANMEIRSTIYPEKD